jgi:hypothetical protein
MSEIQPDLSDKNRCVSVHWSLPVQCVLPCTHAEVWHEAQHPETGNRIRYRRALGVYSTQSYRAGVWHGLLIPPPPAKKDAQVAQLHRELESATASVVALSGLRDALEAKCEQQERDHAETVAEVEKLKAAEQRVRTVLGEAEQHLGIARPVLQAFAERAGAALDGGAS